MSGRKMRGRLNLRPPAPERDKLATLSCGHVRNFADEEVGFKRIDIFGRGYNILICFECSGKGGRQNRYRWRKIEVVGE